MKNKKRGKGRPRLNTSETLKRTYYISEKEYAEVKEWSKKRGFKVSEIVRIGLGQLRREGSLSELLQNEKWRETAISLIITN